MWPFKWIYSLQIRTTPSDPSHAARSFARLYKEVLVFESVDRKSQVLSSSDQSSSQVLLGRSSGGLSIISFCLLGQDTLLTLLSPPNCVDGYRLEVTFRWTSFLLGVGGEGEGGEDEGNGSTASCFSQKSRSQALVMCRAVCGVYMNVLIFSLNLLILFSFK